MMRVLHSGLPIGLRRFLSDFCCFLILLSFDARDLSRGCDVKGSHVNLFTPNIHTWPSRLKSRS